MEITLVLTAFGFGFAAAAARLPPMVGYLAAGFVLHAFGREATPGVQAVADAGVLLLLFGIGLKLRARSMTRREVWGGATVHMAAVTAAAGAVFLGLGALGVSPADGLSAPEAVLVGFGLSFSSTVFAVKALEERNESGALPGQTAIGILIVQDLVAVAFLTVFVDEAPSWWALAVVPAVLLAGPLLGWVLDRVGHGELLLLFGVALALGAGLGAFDAVGLKPDLGALLAGASLARHPRAGELADRLLGLKDLLLIGFFLSIGLGGAPGPGAIAVAAVALVLLPLKASGYFGLLAAFGLRTRTAWHSTLTLANYSEFGLIVIALGVSRGVLDQQWASAMAVAVAASFVIAAPLSTARYGLYRRLAGPLSRLERSATRPYDTLIEPGDADVLVFGMGRIGTGAYDELRARRGDVVLGVDRSEAVVAAHAAAGRTTVRGDALDRDFWDRLRLHPGIRLVVLATGDHAANLEAARRVREFLPDVPVAAAAVHADEVAELHGHGVDVARNLYGEAGQGLADDACDLLAAGDDGEDAGDAGPRT
ncbi:MAG: cation:proton antiporter [Actinobacteria bacterium]|nr:cation:proton antiporter [Actinomycetota bacterium]